jgi:hypothetical protein
MDGVGHAVFGGHGAAECGGVECWKKVPATEALIQNGHSQTLTGPTKALTAGGVSMERIGMARFMVSCGRAKVALEARRNACQNGNHGFKEAKLGLD